MTLLLSDIGLTEIRRIYIIVVFVKPDLGKVRNVIWANEYIGVPRWKKKRIG